MKRILLWTFDRGSFQWDIMCLLILAFMFLIPRHSFEDVPAFMKMTAETVSMTVDRNGNEIFTTRLEHAVFIDTEDSRSLAVASVQQHLGTAVHATRFQPVRDWTGRLVAYAIWKEK